LLFLADLSGDRRTLELRRQECSALQAADLAHHRLPGAERLRIKDALLAAAVPHWCDRDVLAALLQATPEETDRLLGELSAFRRRYG
jgi:hypothetical protein